MNDIGKKIKKARIQQGLTLDDLSNITGISKSSLVRYETNKSMAILMILLVWANTTVLLVNFLTLVYGFGLMGYFFAAYYKKAFGKYLNPEENS